MDIFFYFFMIDWVEVLLPSQPIRVMLSTVSLLNHTFLGQSSKLITITCAYSFITNWQLPFLNEWKEENDHRKYFMIHLHERMLPDLAGFEPVTWTPVRCAYDWHQVDVHTTDISQTCIRMIYWGWLFLHENMFLLNIRYSSVKKF